MPPSVAVSFMQELAGNRLAEREVMLLTEFEHTPHGFLARRLWGGTGCGLASCFLSEGEEVLLQSHTAGLGRREETCFDFRLQVKGDRHGRFCFLSVYVSFHPTPKPGGCPQWIAANSELREGRAFTQSGVGSLANAFQVDIYLLHVKSWASFLA
jgi:hypothetical protein